MPTPTEHHPTRAASEVSAKLAARSRHVIILLGAGASKAAGLPDLAGLQQAALDSLEGEKLEQARVLFEGRNLEEVLSRLRHIVSLLGGGGGEFEGLTQDSALNLDLAITRAIIPALDAQKPDDEPFRRLAIWATGASYRLPLEIFTVNYDLLIETALESVGASSFDGFVGHIRAPFRPELVEEFSTEAHALPSAFVRVWKLHGSVNWAFEGVGPGRRVVRLGTPATEDEIAAIYPSDEKYSDSRRVPFVSYLQPGSYYMVVTGFDGAFDVVDDYRFKMTEAE